MHTYINTYIGIYIYTDTEKIKQILYKGRGKNESDEKVEYILSNFRVYDKVIVIQSATVLRLFTEKNAIVNLEKKYTDIDGVY